MGPMLRTEENAEAVGTHSRRMDAFEDVRDYFIDARERGYAMVTYYT